MSNIGMLDNNNLAIQQAQANYASNISEENSATRPAVASDSAPSFVAIAVQTGMLSSLLQGQSLISVPDSRPALMAPPVGTAKMNAENTSELMKLVNLTKGGDINKLERAAASASTLFTTQPALLQATGNAAANRTMALSAPSSEASTHPVQSQSPVDGGTDITAVNASERQFVNLMGDLKMLALTTQLTEALRKQEAELSKSSALSSQRAVNSAERSGNKSIDAEKQRMNGAITSGTLGMVGQGVSTFRTVKALKTESGSIGNNMAGAAKINRDLGSHKSAVSASSDNMLYKNTKLDQTVEGEFSKGNSHVSAFKNGKDHDHNQVQIKTNKTRVTSDYSNAAVGSTQKIIDGSFNVEAANENKQAELARADQAVNNEIASTHQQSAKKAAESKAALNQALENTRNSDNSAASAIVDRIR